DLLCAQAIGYKLRETSAFKPLVLQDAELPAGKVSMPYRARLRATGGIPFYKWEIGTGSLPAGLTLNTFTGEIAGAPQESGSFESTARVREYDEKSPGVTRKLKFRIEK